MFEIGGEIFMPITQGEKVAAMTVFDDHKGNSALPFARGRIINRRAVNRIGKIADAFRQRTGKTVQRRLRA